MAAFATLLIASCGGGSGSSAPTPDIPWAHGALQGSPQLTATLSPAQLKLRLQNGTTRDQALLLLAGDPVCDVKVQYIQYTTAGGAGALAP